LCSRTQKINTFFSSVQGCGQSSEAYKALIHGGQEAKVRKLILKLFLANDSSSWAQTLKNKNQVKDEYGSHT
jgi:hypothetical protein